MLDRKKILNIYPEKLLTLLRWFNLLYYYVHSAENIHLCCNSFRGWNMNLNNPAGQTFQVVYKPPTFELTHVSSYINPVKACIYIKQQIYHI